MNNDPLAGIQTDDLVKRDGKWQFRENGRTDAKDEIEPTEEELAEFWEQQCLWHSEYQYD